MKQFKYLGYMSKEAEEFFEDNLIREERAGCAVVGHFIKLENGQTVMPSKNQIFIKNEEGKIVLL
jgi:hypothetical protein